MPDYDAWKLSPPPERDADCCFRCFDDGEGLACDGDCLCHLDPCRDCGARRCVCAAEPDGWERAL